MSDDVCGIASAATAAIQALLGDPVWTEDGLFSALDAGWAVDYAMLPDVAVADSARVATFLEGLLTLINSSLRYSVTQVPVRAGDSGAIITPGITEAEFESFHLFMQEVQHPVWIEYAVDGALRGSMCFPRPDKATYLFADVLVDAEQSLCGIFPYFTQVTFLPGHEPERGVSDPLRAFSRASLREMLAQGVSQDEALHLLTRDCEASILVIAALGLSATKVDGDPRAGAKAILGRSGEFEDFRRSKGLPVW